MPRFSPMPRARWLATALVALTFAAYGASLGNEFVNLDDPLLITENPIVRSLNAETIVQAFTTFDPELYIPLTLVSFQIEAAVFGLHPLVFHITNLLLHIANALLVFAVARRFLRTELAAFAVAALFALHPIQTEAVVWAAARKDLLSSFFALWSIFMYLRYRETNGSARYYAGSVVFFALALLSKVGVVLLPCALLLFDLWQERRDIRRMVLDKIPYVALSVLFLVVAIVGKEHVLDDTNMLSKFVLAVMNVGYSLFHIVLPVGLSPMYPITQEQLAGSSGFIMSFLVLMFIAACLLVWRRARVPLLCAGIFLAFIVPSFATFSKGSSIFITSDRYVYLAVLGVFLFVGFLIERLVHTHHRLRMNVMFACAIIVAILGALSIHHSLVWHDSETFNRHIIAVTPGDHRPHYNLGLVLVQDGRDTEAVSEFLRAIEIYPDYMDAALELSKLYVKQHGATDEAKERLATIVRNFPIHPRALHTYGVLLMERGEYGEAATVFERAIEADPKHSPSRHALAEAYGALKRYEDAVEQYRLLKNLDPAYAEKIDLPEL